MLTLVANPNHLQGAPDKQSAGIAQNTTQETVQETTQEKILALIRAQPNITRKEMAHRLGLSDSGIKYHLTKLKTAGITRRHGGATKSGYWEITK